MYNLLSYFSIDFPDLWITLFLLIKSNIKFLTIAFYIYFVSSFLFLSTCMYGHFSLLLLLSKYLLGASNFVECLDETRDYIPSSPYVPYGRIRSTIAYGEFGCSDNVVNG